VGQKMGGKIMSKKGRRLQKQKTAALECPHCQGTGKTVRKECCSMAYFRHTGYFADDYIPVKCCQCGGTGRAAK